MVRCRRYDPLDRGEGVRNVLFAGGGAGLPAVRGLVRDVALAEAVVFPPGPGGSRPLRAAAGGLSADAAALLEGAVRPLGTGPAAALALAALRGHRAGRLRDQVFGRQEGPERWASGAGAAERFLVTKLDR